MLKLTNLSCGYGRISVVEVVDLAVAAGEAVALIGPNGAGKTTLLTAIMGTLRHRGGSVSFDGHDMSAASVHDIVAAGLSLVPEGRMIFGPLTVEDNLRLGAIGLGRPKRSTVEERFAAVYDLFPRLAERRAQIARTLSGGEQQMLAIGRSLMGAPRMMLLDEPFLGLAPKVVDEILTVLERLRSEGLPLLLVEQKLHVALAMAGRIVVMIKGRIVLDTDRETLSKRGDLDRLYFELAIEEARV
jgi:branched-chain amino acid transport system ATP-binding protein